MNNYILERLYEENQNNNLVIFIGSGISKYYSIPPEKFPDWGMLIDELKKKLNIDFNKNKDYLRIAQIFEDKYNRSELLNRVENMFPGYVKPGKLHEKLIEEVKPAHIITTNYDDLIESVEKASVLRYKVLRTDKDFPSSSKHSNFIVKAHGDLKQKNIVLTEKDYLNYHKNFPLFLSFLRYVFAKYRVLFIGFSLTDPNFIKILEDVKDVLGDSSIKHVAIMHDSISEDEKMYFSKKSIIIVTKDEVEKFLVLKEKDNTKYLIEYFEYLYKGFTETKPLDIIQFLERILDIGFLHSFDFVYKDILKDVWNEQGIKIENYVKGLWKPWKIESISTEGTKVLLYDILKIISKEKDINCAILKILEKSSIKPNDDNISKLKDLIIKVLSLLLKSNVIYIYDEFYIPDIIQKLKGLKEKNENKTTEILDKDLDEAFKFLTYTPEIIRMDDNFIKVYIKDYNDNSLEIDGPLWKEIFEEDDFYSKYLRGKANDALFELLKNVNNKNLSEKERFLLLYRFRHICRITGYRKEECLFTTKEIENILENSDKKTQTIISYFNQEKFISSFQEFVDFKKIVFENNSNKKDELKDEFYVEYSSVLKFIISNKLPVLHYLKMRHLIKFVLEYFFKKVYSNQNNNIIDISEWFVIGILLLNFESFSELISNFYNTRSNVEKIKLSKSTKEYLRKTLEKLLEKEIGFSENYRVIYPENLVLLLLLFSSEEKDIELFVKYWKKYVLAVQHYGINSNNLFGVFGSMIKNIESNKKIVNQYLAKYISNYRVLDDYIEIFLNESRVRTNFLDHLVENLEILASKKIKVLCNNKLINKLEDFLNKEFENLSEQLSVLNFIFYIFFLCKVKEDKILKIIDKVAAFDFSKEVEDSERFNLIEYLKTLYKIEKILKVKNKKLTTEFILEKTLSVLKYELKSKGYNEDHVVINAMHFLVDLILNEEIKITEKKTSEFEEVIEGYLNQYGQLRNFGGPLLYGSNFWNYFSILCLYFLVNNKDSKLKKKIKDFFEDFCNEEKVRFIVLTVKSSVYRKEILKLLREILCKVDTKKMLSEKSWFLELMCEEKNL